MSEQLTFEDIPESKNELAEAQLKEILTERDKCPICSDIGECRMCERCNIEISKSSKQSKSKLN